ncbi:putative fibrinogen-like protein A-like [Apostichopus japonicus]|uniref:Putative fibrinogen-like protein A-like n=1 Tax=Stichopus japonicus TaxID=307972 RepID=A0A2G8L5Z7_STIJA|nr:putative fibrinogen-like protein A-like [Apostichopus japonicus]
MSIGNKVLIRLLKCILDANQSITTSCDKSVRGTLSHLFCVSKKFESSIRYDDSAGVQFCIPLRIGISLLHDICIVSNERPNEVYYRQPTFPKDCHEIFHDTCDWENVTSGVYLIKPTDSLEPFQVYCNNSIDGGGWTVFQRRIDGSIYFYRNWNDYTKGFGFLHREFWLGNEKLSFLTNQNDYSLRIDVTDIHGNSYFAKYELFRISDENGKYRLVNIDDYDSNSTTGDDKHVFQYI